MPLVTSITPKALDESTKDALKSGIGEIMNRVAGKSESWLMVRFSEDDTLYFRGEKVEDGALVDIKLIGSLSPDQKKALVREICDLYSKKASFKGENIYVTIEEYQGSNWGWNGSTF